MKGLFLVVKFGIVFAISQADNTFDIVISYTANNNICLYRHAY